MNNKMKKTNSAVSLVELAVVILVLGILVAVVTGSNSLVKAAKIRKVVNEVNTIVTAHRAFESKFDAIAGDMIDAYDFFGTDCVASASSADCNGDGDLHVDGMDSVSASAQLNDSAEYIRYFQHLKLANVLEGDYVGTGVVPATNAACSANAPFASTCVRKRNYNTPKTSISTRGYYLVGYNSTDEYNVITLGDTNTADYTGVNAYELLTSLDVKSIDLKLDDGHASNGRLIGLDGASVASGSECLTTTGGEYDPTVTGENCYFKYIIR